MIIFAVLMFVVALNMLFGGEIDSHPDWECRPVRMATGTSLAIIAFNSASAAILMLASSATVLFMANRDSDHIASAA
jgi:uncharacterized membrane protein YfcA